MKKSRPRVIMGRFELDGHDRGIITVMNALRDAGVEVIYIHFSNPRELAKAAIEEDVDLVGITSSLGQHLLTARTLLDEIEKSKVSLPVIMGGVIPTTDVTELMKMGVKKIFGPGSTPQEAVSSIHEYCEKD